MSGKEAFNEKYNFKKNTTHNKNEISKLTDIPVFLLDAIYDESLEKNNDNYAMAMDAVYHFILDPKSHPDVLFQVLQHWNISGGAIEESGEYQPLKPFFGRVGSKMPIRQQVLDAIPSHKTYVEPFVGGGAIFWGKPPSEKDVINDLDSFLIEGYRLLKKTSPNPDDYPFPKTQAEGATFDEAIQNIQRFVNTPHKTIEGKLLAILYQLSNTFGSKGIGKIYKEYSHRTKINKVASFISRIKNTVIMEADYIKVIKKYDSPTTFFFLDPPYEESKGLYKDAIIDYDEMNELLKKIKGKFLLTINDSPTVKKVFSNFKITPIIVKGGAHNSSSHIGAGSRKELFITNY